MSALPAGWKSCNVINSPGGAAISLHVLASSLTSVPFIHQCKSTMHTPITPTLAIGRRGHQERARSLLREQIHSFSRSFRQKSKILDSTLKWFITIFTVVIPFLLFTIEIILVHTNTPRMGYPSETSNTQQTRRIMTKHCGAFPHGTCWGNVPFVGHDILQQCCLILSKPCLLACSCTGMTWSQVRSTLPLIFQIFTFLWRKSKIE